jgi:hypothetical protein
MKAEAGAALAGVRGEEWIERFSGSLDHCLTCANSLPDHNHDRSSTVKSAAVGVIASQMCHVEW